MLKKILITMLLFAACSAAAKDPDDKVLRGSNKFVARVIFAEAASGTPKERRLVASVIKNRIRHTGFGKGRLQNMEAVCREEGAFTCITDFKNKQWIKTQNWGFIETCTEKEKEVWVECLALSRGTFSPITEVVAYHDTSIKKPLSWENNKYYKYYQKVKTIKFVFYGITPRK
jgi:hypothetical protein